MNPEWRFACLGLWCRIPWRSQSQLAGGGLALVLCQAAQAFHRVDHPPGFAGQGVVFLLGLPAVAAGKVEVAL